MKNKNNFYGKENSTGYSVLGYNRNRAQYKIALDLLKYVPIKGKVLDVACGFGEFADILKEIGFEVVCVDGAGRLIEDIKQRGYEGYKINLEYQKLPFGNNEFDIVVSLDTIEHIWNTGHYLAEIVRVLKPSGYAIFTTPNYNCWTYRIVHLLGNLEKITYKNAHMKFYTAKSFRQELGKYFKVKKSVGKVHLPIVGNIRFDNEILISRFQNFLSKNTGILGIPKKRAKRSKKPITRKRAKSKEKPHISQASHTIQENHVEKASHNKLGIQESRASRNN